MIAADWIIRHLEQRGIGHAFGVVGGASIFLTDALRRAERMKFVACHHEQAATIAADAYARARNGLGLAIVTSGPGGTNAITGVASAWLDHVPTITLSGQVFSGQTITGRGLRQVGVQEINIIDLVRPITKYARQVRSAVEVRYELECALWHAQEGRPGPVWLDIPADVQKAEIDADKLPGFYPPMPARVSCFAQVQQVVDLLLAAKRPLLHIGQGVRIAGAEDALTEFLSATGIPVLTARNANDMLGSDHPQYIGRAGTFAQRGANFAVQTCDLYIAVGTRLSLAQTGYNAKDYARNAKVVMVDVDAAELAKGTARVDFPVQADAGDFLNAINCELRHLPGVPDWSPWLKRCTDWQERYPVVTDAMRYSGGEGVNVYAFVELLSSMLSESHIVVTDVGDAYQCTHQAFHVKHGQRLLSSNGLAPMGWALPAAIGAHFATGRRVVCIAGDGGLMMNIQELSVLQHHRIPVKLFVLNNCGYATMRRSQDNAFGGRIGSDPESGISFPVLGRIAEAHAIPWFSAFSHAKMESAIEATLSGSEPSICELACDPAQVAMHAINRRDAAGNILPGAIEDAFPYLDRAEIERNLRIDQ